MNLRLKLTVAYDGTDYIGWQKQAAAINGKTVEGTLSKALSKLLRESVVLCAAGRTDAGVHALGQTVHFDTALPIPPAIIPVAVNRLLPSSIRVLKAMEAGESFHARKSALAKTYRYTLSMAENADFQVFGCRYFWPLGHTLNMESLKKAADYFVGSHDFSAFSVKGRPVKSAVRTIYRVKIFHPADNLSLPWCHLPGGLCLEISGSGFLYKMARLMTARLVQVGLGRLKAEEIKNLLRGKILPPVPPAPPGGLMLLKVSYPQNTYPL
jgi:tRNA pseudouridine38-40 synthase